MNEDTWKFQMVYLRKYWSKIVIGLFTVEFAPVLDALFEFIEFHVANCKFLIGSQGYKMSEI